MRLEVFAIGKLKKSPMLSLLQDYEKRIAVISKSIGFKSFQISEFDTKKNLEGDSLKTYEAGLLLDNQPSALIALDETGDVISSQKFAKIIDHYKDTNHNACRFVIGGADGLCPSVRKQASKIISFGALTWPHMLVRVMIAEQIYRTMTILTNHPYHRE